MEIGTHKVKERVDRHAYMHTEIHLDTYLVYVGGKVQTLKKFKQVLDFRLREVTDSLKPKEDMIAQLHLCSFST